jgi:hypothetical protein
MRSILRSSLANTARQWPILLVLWLAALLTALPFALLPGEALLSLANRPVIAEMADGIDSWQWVDLFGVIQGGSTAGLPPNPACSQARPASPTPSRLSSNRP